MTVKKKSSLMQRFLNVVERGGNALPHPATLFLLLALMTLAFSMLIPMLLISLKPVISQQEETLFSPYMMRTRHILMR